MNVENHKLHTRIFMAECIAKVKEKMPYVRFQEAGVDQNFCHPWCEQTPVNTKPIFISGSTQSDVRPSHAFSRMKQLSCFTNNRITIFLIIKLWTEMTSLWYMDLTFQTALQNYAGADGNF